MSISNIDKIADSIAHHIQDMLQKRDYVLIAIDGRCGSGKTTLAAYLKEKLGCEVIHMDDFFLRPEQRTKERLKEVGGNVDYERFFEEVMIPLKEKKDFSYRPYDCHTMDFKYPILVRQNQVILVEGAYSAHPNLWKEYDLHIFLDVDKEIQYDRICQRNGKKMAQKFKNLWIPLEEAYFFAFHIQEKCELQYKN